MENRYPLFAGGRILKKEALWDLRDYAYGGWQLYYADYTDGVIKGCNVRVEGMNLVIGKGILKYGDFIYFLQEEATVPYAAENREKILKVVFEKKPENPDYLAYTVQFFLDDNPERQENQMELCRFHLREGAVLRDTYKDFYDIGTEYDTINLLYATMSGKGHERLHPQILIHYAQELLKHSERNMEDGVFCYQIMQNVGEVEEEVLNVYLTIKQREEKEKKEYSCKSEGFFRKLVDILVCSDNSYNESQRQKIIIVE